VTSTNYSQEAPGRWVNIIARFPANSGVAPLTAPNSAWLWRLHALYVVLVNFFRTPLSNLTRTQKMELERQLLEKLARRAAYWVGTLFVASILVITLGVVPAPNLVHRIPITGWAFSSTIWAVGLWSLLLFYTYLLRRIISLPSDATLKSVQTTHLIWCVWISVVACWWLVGALTLESPPIVPLNPPRFIFGEMTFVFLTLIGNVLTVVILAPSRVATFSALTIGYLAPFWLFVMPDIPHPVVASTWISGQLLLDLVIAWLVGTDQRRIYARGVHAEAERSRANNFVAAISHDLRQPLTTLALKIRSLKERATTPEMLADIQALQQQTSAIETMVSGTLDLSRLEAGTWTVQPREVALHYVVQNVVSDLQTDALAKNVRLEVRSLPYIVLTDPIALERILRNLVGNALRYTPGSEADRPGSVVVECELRDNMMCVSVIDNGIGIPTNKLEDIFKEYVQVANPERDRSKGLGLGLSIVKGLSDLLGHKLAVESTIGEGSRFSLMLPVVGRIPLELLGHAQNEGDTPDLTGLVIVFVEDERGPREALSERLVELGCLVVDGESAAEVIGKLRDQGVPYGPHFVLADYRLRDGRTGIGAIREIREKTGLLSLPGAIWTAETKPSVFQEVAAEGLPMFAKPPDERALLDLLARHRPLVSSAMVSSHPLQQVS